MENRDAEEGESKKNEFERNPEKGGRIWIDREVLCEHDHAVTNLPNEVNRAGLLGRFTFPCLSDQERRVRNAAVIAASLHSSAWPVLFPAGLNKNVSLG